MNKGTIVLVGCILGAGALFYMKTSAGAARPTAPDPAATVTPTKELAHSQATPRATATSARSSTPGATATPTPLKLTLVQAKNLPRPIATLPAASGYPGSGGYASPGEPPAEPVATETPSPDATLPGATTVPGSPPSEQPSTPTPLPSTPIPTPAPTQNPNPWPIPTPPTLPPYPDGGLSPNPPSE